MSHELFELFGMLGAGMGLTALFQRALQPLRLRLAGGSVNPKRFAAVTANAGSDSAAISLSRHRSSPSRLDSTT